MRLISSYSHRIRLFQASALSLTFALLPLTQAMATTSQAEADKQAQENAVFDR